MIVTNISGIERISDNIDRLTTAVKGKLLRTALMGTAEPIRATAAALCPVGDSTGMSAPGVLKNSIEIKFTTRVGGGTYTGGFAMVIIGPRRGIKVPIRIISRGPRAGQVLFAIPTKYAALVEFGHELKDRTGKNIGHVGPRAYMRPAWDAAGGEVALTRFVAIMSDGVVEEVSKL